MKSAAVQYVEAMQRTMAERVQGSLTVQADDFSHDVGEPLAQRLSAV